MNKYIWTGTCHVAVKRVIDTEPFAVVEVPCAELERGKWVMQRPPNRIYKRGGRGVHYKLLPETYRPFIETRLND